MNVCVPGISVFVVSEQVPVGVVAGLEVIYCSILVGGVGLIAGLGAATSVKAVRLPASS
jgi:hypothetical protein